MILTYVRKIVTGAVWHCNFRRTIASCGKIGLHVDAGLVRG